MGTDEPPFVVLIRHGILDVLQVVIRWQVKLICGRDVVINELSAILDNTKSLVGIILLARLYVDEVLFDILCLLVQLLLLFKLLLISLYLGSARSPGNWHEGLPVEHGPANQVADELGARITGSAVH